MAMLKKKNPLPAIVAAFTLAAVSFGAHTAHADVTGGLANEVTFSTIFNTVIHAESQGHQFDKHGNPLRSTTGAIGVAQVLPSTGPEAAELAGHKWNPYRFHYDREYNHDLGEAYFGKQLQDFGSPSKAFAAYNGGPNALRRALAEAEEEGNPKEWLKHMSPETQGYVAYNVRKLKENGIDADDDVDLDGLNLGRKQSLNLSPAAQGGLIVGAGVLALTLLGVAASAMTKASRRRRGQSFGPQASDMFASANPAFALMDDNSAVTATAVVVQLSQPQVVVQRQPNVAAAAPADAQQTPPPGPQAAPDYDAQEQLRECARQQQRAAQQQAIDDQMRRLAEQQLKARQRHEQEQAQENNRMLQRRMEVEFSRYSQTEQAALFNVYGQQNVVPVDYGAKWHTDYGNNEYAVVRPGTVTIRGIAPLKDSIQFAAQAWGECVMTGGNEKTRANVVAVAQHLLNEGQLVAADGSVMDTFTIKGHGVLKRVVPQADPAAAPQPGRPAGTPNGGRPLYQAAA